MIELQIGGYESDCSLARLSDNHYMMIAPIIQQTYVSYCFIKNFHFSCFKKF